MPEVKLRIQTGTNLTRGVADRQLDRKRVRGLVTGLTDDTTVRKRALDAVRADAAFSLTDDEVTDLTLASEAALRVGPGICVVDLVYARSATSDPTRPAFEMCREVGFSYRYRTTWKIYNTTTETSSDAPLNTAFTLDSDEVLYADRYRSPLTQVAVATVLDANPVDQVKSLYRATNTDAVLIGNVERGASELRFWNVQLSAVDTPNGVRWPLQYIYEYAPDTFLKYELVVSGLGTGTVTYTIEDVPPGKTAAFAGAFPTHDGTGPSAPTP